MNAIIVEDNVKNLNILAQLLRMAGVNHTGVTNPLKLDEAIAPIQSADVVFVDLEMPGMNGYQVLEKMKADPRFTNVPIVAYTVHTNEIQNASQQGFDGFLGKPLSVERFPDQLQRILRHEPVWEAVS